MQHVVNDELLLMIIDYLVASTMEGINANLFMMSYGRH